MTQSHHQFSKFHPHSRSSPTRKESILALDSAQTRCFTSRATKQFNSQHLRPNSSDIQHLKRITWFITKRSSKRTMNSVRVQQSINGDSLRTTRSILQKSKTDSLQCWDFLEATNSNFIYVIKPLFGSIELLSNLVNLCVNIVALTIVDHVLKCIHSSNLLKLKCVHVLV